MSRKRIFMLLMVAIWFSSFSCYGREERPTDFSFYFRSGSSKIDLDYMENRATLDCMRELLTEKNAKYFKSLHLSGYASPEGVSAVNDRLAAERAAAVKSYILSRHPYLSDNKITTEGVGINWEKLRELVSTDSFAPNRAKILHIIENVPAGINLKMNTSRKKRLMDLGVPTWNYMLNHHFPLMRVGASMVVTLISDTPREIREAIEKYPLIDSIIVSAALSSDINGDEKSLITSKLDSLNLLLSRIDGKTDVFVAQNNLERVEELIRRTEAQMALTGELKSNCDDRQINSELEEIDSQLRDIHRRLLAIRERLQSGVDIPQSIIPQSDQIGKPLFAIKTNLLFDLASLVNVEIEVPLGQRWSVAGEYIFPWWLWEKKQHCLQSLSGNLEGRYWLGRDEHRPLLTGWYCGLYVGGGYYDLEWNKKGYQGEFYIAGGLSGGYAHTINRKGTLRMEYGIGIGYLETHYRQYEARLDNEGEWHLMRRQNGKYNWFGPTRAKVSLVWMLHYNKKGDLK